MSPGTDPVGGEKKRKKAKVQKNVCSVLHFLIFKKGIYAQWNITQPLKRIHLNQF